MNTTSLLQPTGKKRQIVIEKGSYQVLIVYYMKFSVLVLLASYLVGVNSLIVDTSEELICPDPENPLIVIQNCLFQQTSGKPLNQVKIYHLGYTLNIDTLEKEAKLMSADEKTSQFKK